MALNETICVLGSEPSDVEALNFGKWVGSLIAIGLILVAVVGFVIRGLFIYYLTYEAQKDRTINTLIYDEQVTQMSTMSVVSIMTAVPIAIQTPMAKVFGEKSCYFFWVANNIYLWKLITSGLGMAIYRLICFKFLFKRNLNTKSMARKTMAIEWIVVGGALVTSATLFSMYGWEKAPNYQYCKDIGHEQVETLRNYKIDQYNTLVFMGTQVFLGLVGRSFILLELLIYLWIVYHLWKHDEENFRDKIITDQMRRARNHKNVITLRGQVITFLIEILYSIYLIFHNAQADFVDASFTSISLIISSTIISLVQILTSHEMMRFVKRHFNLF